MLLYNKIIKKLDIYQSDFIKTYISLIKEDYEPDDIKTIFLFDFKKKFSNKEKKFMQDERNKFEQQNFRKNLIKRYNNCIVSNLSCHECEAAHIIPYSISKNFSLNNGLLLQSGLHLLFDKKYWSINPDTFRIEIFVKGNYLINQYNGKVLENLKNFNNKEFYENLKVHYMSCKKCN